VAVSPAGHHLVLGLARGNHSCWAQRQPPNHEIYDSQSHGTAEGRGLIPARSASLRTQSTLSIPAPAPLATMSQLLPQATCSSSPLQPCHRRVSNRATHSYTLVPHHKLYCAYLLPIAILARYGTFQNVAHSTLCQLRSEAAGLYPPQAPTRPSLHTPNDFQALKATLSLMHSSGPRS
jgi:hypothetical protein